MKHGRWYPSTIVLADGNVMIMDGHPEDDVSKSDPLDFYNQYSLTHVNYDLEIYSPTSNELFLFQNTNVSSDYHKEPNTGDTTEHPEQAAHDGLYPRIHLLNNGEIFSSSIIRSHPDPNAENYKKIALSKQSTFNLVASTDRIEIRGIFKWDPYNPGYPNRVSTTDDCPYVEDKIDLTKDVVVDTSVLMPLRYPYKLEDNAIFILSGKIACICSPFAKDKKDIWKILYNRPATLIPNGKGKSEVQSRTHCVGVILPDGKIMIVAGINSPIHNYSGNGILQPEVYDPQTGIWEVILPTLSIPRSYHAVSILLPDGRVMVGFSNRFGYNSDDTKFDPFDPLIKREKSLEIYSPPYLFIEPKPVFELDTSKVQSGGFFTITILERLDQNDINLNKIAAIRCASMTHGFVYDQRYVQLRAVFHPTDSQKIIIYTPDPKTSGPQSDTKGIMPPGPYMIFIFSILGGCSESKTIFIE